MRSLILALMLLVLSAASFSQNINPRTTYQQKNLAPRDTIFFTDLVNGVPVATGRYIIDDSVNNRIIIVGTVLASGLIGGGGGGGGTITSVSSDGSITVTNGSGPAITIAIPNSSIDRVKFAVGAKIYYSDTSDVARKAIGNAGGSLTGQYPNPTIATGAVTGDMVLNGTLGTVDFSLSATIPKSDTSNFSKKSHVKSQTVTITGTADTLDVMIANVAKVLGFSYATRPAPTTQPSFVIYSNKFTIYPNEDLDDNKVITVTYEEN